ncbi:murein biosynthesis integral membrane protein MurJ [Acidihalobacter ferrooxydans]|uniref:Probable lipid II flippase MurJ n=1 Tax=Acidihalobacter ferrooxydans TaxID=1765967 RepID=A0A1P8UKU8_9GAMM|nr:murein biosynthesis integral membrane protein MurJ [Acidihalobacter ferrooxydans]
MSHKLFRSTAVVSAMTLVSRIFGYLRDVVIAIHFGADGATDAFFVAFRIPNFLRRLFAEGAFSQAFVPIFMEYKERQDPQQLRELLARTAGTLFGVLAIVTAVGVIGAPLLIVIFAPGFTDDPHRYALATQMLRLTFPYLLFISLTALAGGVLNSFGRFAVPAFTPVFLNLSLIGVTLWLAPHMPEPVVALAVGVLIAGVVQLAFQIPFMHRMGLLPMPRWGGKSEGVRRIMHLMLPALFGSSVVQVNLLFDTLVASFLPAGSISWLYYSDRFVEMPLALFGIALGTVILPKLSQHSALGAAREYADTLDWAIRVAGVVALPSALGLMVLAGPILTALIEYHAFSAFDARMSALSLAAFAVGLPAFMLLKVLAPGFYARQDTRTPVRVGIIAMVVNMGLTVVIVLPWYLLKLPGPHAGLALSTSLAAYLNAVMLYRRLRRNGAYPHPRWGALLLRAAVASIGMVVVLLAFSPPVHDWAAWPARLRALHLAELIFLGGGAYVLLLAAMGVRPRHLMHA